MRGRKLHTTPWDCVGTQSTVEGWSMDADTSPYCSDALGEDSQEWTSELPMTVLKNIL